MFLIELIATLVALQSVRKCSVAARLIMAGAVSVAVGRHSGKGVSESLFSKFFIFHFLPFLVRATSLYKSLFCRPSIRRPSIRRPSVRRASVVCPSSVHRPSVVRPSIVCVCVCKFSYLRRATSYVVLRCSLTGTDSAIELLAKFYPIFM